MPLSLVKRDKEYYFVLCVLMFYIPCHPRFQNLVHSHWFPQPPCFHAPNPLALNHTDYCMTVIQKIHQCLRNISLNLEIASFVIFETEIFMFSKPRYISMRGLRMTEETMGKNLLSQQLRFCNK